MLAACLQFPMNIVVGIGLLILGAIFGMPFIGPVMEEKYRRKYEHSDD